MHKRVNLIHINYILRLQNVNNICNNILHFVKLYKFTCKILCIFTPTVSPLWEAS